MMTARRTPIPGRSWRPAAAVLAVLIASWLGPLTGRAAAAAVDFRLIDLGTLGGRETFPVDLNDRGVVVGASYSDGGLRGFVWQRGSMQPVGPRQFTSQAHAVNERGQVLGTFTDESGVLQSFVWHRGGTTVLPTLGGQRTAANAINERGQIAGTSEDPDGVLHAVLWEDGQIRDLGSMLYAFWAGVALGEQGQVAFNSDGHGYLWEDDRLTDLGSALPGIPWAYTVPVDIDDHGTVTGYTINAPGGDVAAFQWRQGNLRVLPRGDAYPAGVGCLPALHANNRGQVIGGVTVAGSGCHAAVRTVRGVQDLGTFGGASSTALGINRHGVVVGWAELADGGRFRAAWWAGGAAIDIGVLPGDVSSKAMAVNDRGQVIGQSIDADGTTHGFLAERSRRH
jgi:probable HAF family extracellular repeat protein